jgi:predicted transposase YbfD/YdcC
MIGVWDAETRVSIAACASADGNEVAATLKALQSLDLKGCVVTADALHCHPKMAAAVRATGAHYALRLKRNHAPLHACAVQAFAQADARGDLAFHQTSNTGHDRSERRRASVIAVPADAPDFPGLALFGRIESERRTADGKISTFRHYAVLSKAMTPQVMMATMRAHWGIENQLHWPLDVIFNEDAARTRKNHAPQNLAFIRRMALDILRAHPDKRSVARKMKLATWSKPFFFELFTHMR